jgi:hypothetical protein
LHILKSCLSRMQHTGSISPVRNVDRILQRARGKQWMVEGFAVDDPPRAFVRPHEWVYSAPSHLECLFEPCSTKAETLQLATDPVANGVTEEEIEKTALDVLLILDNWSQGVDVAAIVECLPFGSKFMLVEKHPQGPHVYLVPNFELQRRCLLAQRLQELWPDKETVLPPCVDLQHIKAIQRLSDSVSLVSVGHENSKKVVLKAITDVISRMYHEIRVLLQMPPHPNVISRPSYLVTRKGRDDAEALVCGFTVEYHSGGSLSDVLPTRERSGTLMYSDQIKWSKQLLSAFRHIHGPAKSFYSDIKLDNIILSDTDDHIDRFRADRHS